MGQSQRRPETHRTATTSPSASRRRARRRPTGPVRARRPAACYPRASTPSRSSCSAARSVIVSDVTRQRAVRGVARRGGLPLAGGCAVQTKRTADQLAVPSMCDPSAGDRLGPASARDDQVCRLAGLGREPPQPRRGQLHQIVAALARPREAQRDPRRVRPSRLVRRGDQPMPRRAPPATRSARRPQRQVIAELGDRAKVTASGRRRAAARRARRPTSPGGGVKARCRPWSAPRASGVITTVCNSVKDCMT